MSQIVGNLLRILLNTFGQQCYFAWADDVTMQEEIITLDTREKIYRFCKRHKDAIFVIDQVNAFAELDDGKTQFATWLENCRAGHNTVLSTSANYDAYTKLSSKQTTEDTLCTYGGLNAVGLSNINCFAMVILTVI